MSGDALVWLQGGLAIALIAAGLGFMFGGLIGGLRFPDFYTRVHGAFVAQSPGAALVVLGLAPLAADVASAMKLVLLAALLAALAPLCMHLLGASAHAGGLTPRSGAYVAPRPGRREVR